MKRWKMVLTGMCAAAGLLIGAMPAVCEEETTEAAKEADEEIQMSVGTLLGGWQATEDAAVTEELQAVFEKALEGLLGVDYEPVAYLGSQVVAGRNHCFLSRARTVYPGAQPYYVFVMIYEDLQGNAKLNSIIPLSFEDLANARFSTEEIAEHADYLYVDYDFMTDEPVGVWYLVPEEDLSGYTCISADGTDAMPVAYGTAKELLDAAFLAGEEETNVLPVSGGKGAILWQSPDGVCAYVRNYKDYGDTWSGDEEGSMQVSEADLAALEYMTDEEEINALIESFGEDLIIPESEKDA